MATIDKDFKIKNGLVVEGSNATVNGNQVLRENDSDQYIIDLIGGETLVTSVNSTQLEVVNGELSVKSGVFEPAGSIDALTTDDISEGTTNKYYTDARVKNVLTTATKTNIVIEEIAGELHITAENGVADSTTDNLAEGTNNLYFQDGRAVSAVSNALGNFVEYNGSTFDVQIGTGLQDNGSNQIEINRTTVDAWYDAAGSASDVATDLSTHEQATTGVHGVTGNIVGTSDTQTLTNKTLEGTVYLGVDNTNAAYIQTETDSAGNLTVHAGNDLTLSTNSGDIILNPDGSAYVGSATAGNEIATNSYVDNAVSGLAWKQAVNLFYDDSTPTLSGNELTTPLVIDGHNALTIAENGYRILVAYGNDAGIYVYNENPVDSSWTLTRAEDADTYTELVGAAVYVMEGTQYGSTSWVQGNHYLTNFTGQDWTQFSGQGSVTAGTGIIVNGLEVSVDTDVIATQFYADSAVGTHSDYTSNIHGVTGDVVGTSDSQSLSNKTFMGQTNFQSAGGAGGTNNHIDVDNSTGKMTVESGYSLDLKSSNDVTVISNSADIVLNADGNSYLWNKNSENQIATHGYVDNQTTDDVSEGSTNLYFTQTRARESLSAGNAISYNNASGEIAVDASQLDTDDIAEGTVNHYYTDSRARTAGIDLLVNHSTKTNITITEDQTNLGNLIITAENGVADSDTDDLTEGSTNLYFTDARAVSAISGADISPATVSIDTYRKEEATQQYVANASTVTAHTFAYPYGTAKYLVRVVGSVGGTMHTQVTELLATIDGNNNVAVTEYGTIYTSENALATATVDYSSGSFRLRVTTLANGLEVVAAATLLSWAD